MAMARYIMDEATLRTFRALAPNSRKTEFQTMKMPGWWSLNCYDEGFTNVEERDSVVNGDSIQFKCGKDDEG